MFSYLVFSPYIISKAQTKIAQATTPFQLHGQVIPPSPSGSAFSKYITNPVGYYTGIPVINVPLWEIKLKDFTLPIDLSYHAGGIKVSDVSSSVGLGWVLNAGGVITRVVKDMPDDQTSEYCSDTYDKDVKKRFMTKMDIKSDCGNGLLWAYQEPKNPEFKKYFNGLTSYDIDLKKYQPNGTEDPKNLLKKFYGFAQGEKRKSTLGNWQELYLTPAIDKEPDIFYFNFAGRIGRFIFDMSSQSPQIRVFPYQDLIISYSVDKRKKIKEFRIIDERGIKYIFNTVEKTSITASPCITDESKSNNCAGGPDKNIDSGQRHQVHSSLHSSYTKKHSSSWYLSKVETPLGEFLNFSYKDEAYRVDSRGPQQTGLRYNFLYKNKYNPNSPLFIDKHTLIRGGYYNQLLKNYSVTEGKRLSKIENNEIKIDFEANHLRKDLAFPDTYMRNPVPPYAISKITIYTKIGGVKRIKKFELNYDYWKSSPKEWINRWKKIAQKIPKRRYKLSTVCDVSIEVSDSAAYYHRLKLLSIKEYGPEDNHSIPPYTFEYKEKDYRGNTLPHRLSFQRDFWGYFNAQNLNLTLIPELYVYPKHFPIKDSRQYSIFSIRNHRGQEYNLLGAQRWTNHSTVALGMLTKINYPTGGFTKYEYESHQFNYAGQKRSGGGVRIGTVTKHDGKDHANDIVYEYSYTQSPDEIYSSSGEVISLPIFADRNKNIAALQLKNNDSLKNYQLLTTRYSIPLLTIGKTNGSYVGYRKVTEYIKDNGKVVRKYSMPATHNVPNDLPKSEPGGECDPKIDGHCDGYYSLTPVVDIIIPGHRYTKIKSTSAYDLSQNPAVPNTLPYPDNPNYDWQRGHLLSKQVYGSSGNLITETNYKYKNYFPNGKTAPTKVYGYKFAHHYPLLKTQKEPNSNSHRAYFFRVAKYKVLTNMTKVLDVKTEKNYDPINPAKVLTTTTQYKYTNSTLPKVTRELTTDSRNREWEHTFDYTGDLSNNELGSNLLQTKHMTGKLLRESSFVNTRLVAKKETQYKSKNNYIMPVVALSYPNGGEEVIKEAYDYDLSGNVVNIAKIIQENADGNITSSDIHNSYFWGYSKKYPVLKVQNSQYNDLLNNLSTSDIALLNGVPTTSQIIAIHSKLKSKMPKAMIYGYTYDPLVGMTSQTDPNGLTTYYEYDGMGRLHLIKDNDGNIIKEITYKYKK